MRSIRIRFVVAALVALLGTALGRAQSDDAVAPPPMHGHEFGMGAPHMIGFFADKLDLTDAQHEQIKAIMQKEHPVMKPLMQQSHQIELQLRQYAEGTYDEAKVRTLATQQAKVELELSVQRTRIHNELFQVLTPEQQTKMKEMEAQHEAHMASHRPPAPAEE
jgi:Spy/CpxP family protein refolding chaperone